MGEGSWGQVAVPASRLSRSNTAPAWEDNKHLLATWTQSERQAIVRIGLDGAVTRASEWTRSRFSGFAFLR